MSEQAVASRRKRAVVTGAGGFIGHHLGARLRRDGFEVVGIDVNRPEFEPTHCHTFHVQDLRADPSVLEPLFQGADHVYHLAADMGGIGYINAHPAKLMRNNMRIDLNLLQVSQRVGAARFFYPSSACVYPNSRTATPDAPALKEEYAIPAEPQDAYGWEKVMGEQLCRHYREEFGLETRIARFHTMYGPLGTWQGGREKFPAAICRKVALADDGSEIEVWGDGQQTRTFCYVDDTVEGIRRLMESDYTSPLNIGSAETHSVDETARMVIELAGKRGLRLRHVPGPQGLRGRVPDNTLCREVLGWEPTIPARFGFEQTYRWIESQTRGQQAPPGALASTQG